MPEQVKKIYDTKYVTRPLEAGGEIIVPGGFDRHGFTDGFRIGTEVPDDIDPKDETVGIIVQPASITPNTVEAYLNIKPEHSYINNKFNNAGELLVLMKNSLRDIDFIIDDMGELVVSAEDSKNYSIDEMGELTYTNR